MQPQSTTPRLCIICQKPLGPQAKKATRCCSRSCAARSIKRPSLPEHFWRFVDCSAVAGCWPWTGFRDKDGYGWFKHRSSVPVRAHRMAFMLSNDETIDGLFVCHHCDNPPCCRPDHLFRGTVRDNSADAVAKGRQVRGERQGESKLTSADVIAIRLAFAQGATQLWLATQYPVCQATISKIVLRRSWQHVIP
jgi:hypothetical protein